MVKDRKYTVRLTDPEADALESFCDDRGYNYSEGVRRILESRLRSEGLLGQEIYGNSEKEKEEEPIADGGFIRLSDHPWINPIITVIDYSVIFGLLLTGVALLSVFVAIPLVETFGAVGLIAWVGGFYALSLLGAMMVLVSVIGIGLLEYLMHPSEAPIRRYFYDHKPEPKVTHS